MRLLTVCSGTNFPLGTLRNEFRFPTELVLEKVGKCKEGMGKKGLRVNAGKTKKNHVI